MSTVTETINQTIDTQEYITRISGDMSLSDSIAIENDSSFDDNSFAISEDSFVMVVPDSSQPTSKAFLTQIRHLSMSEAEKQAEREARLAATETGSEPITSSAWTYQTSETIVRLADGTPLFVDATPSEYILTSDESFDVYTPEGSSISYVNNEETTVDEYTARIHVLDRTDSTDLEQGDIVRFNDGMSFKVASVLSGGIHLTALDPSTKQLLEEKYARSDVTIPRGTNLYTALISSAEAATIH